MNLSSVNIQVYMAHTGALIVLAQVKVTSRATVSRPVSPGVKPHLGSQDQIFVIIVSAGTSQEYLLLKLLLRTNVLSKLIIHK
jgi:hypothetical protein